MQQHDSGDEVEAQEHGHAEHHVQVGLGLRRRVGEGQPRPPLELKVPGDGVHGRHQQLQGDQQHPLHRHGDAPVVGAVVDDEQLQLGESGGGGVVGVGGVGGGRKEEKLLILLIVRRQPTDLMIK